MEVLRSALMHGAEKIEEQPPLGGLYGPDGFFFQQRRGHLNLRSVASLNLDKLVREVDIDLLQIHIENITFCNLREEDLRYLTDPQIVKLFRIAQLMLEYLLYSQDKLVENLNSYAQKYAEKKKSLAKKRRELAELEESTKLLRNQVKAKKQNIATLEDLLREANRTREKELRKLKMKSGEVPEQRPAILHFFIAGPEGLCVEFTQKAETTIAQLHKEARKAFISRRDVDVSYDVDAVELRLVFKGKLLLPDQTIEECEIREGDTIMAMLVERKRPAEPVAPSQPVQAPAQSGLDTEAFAKQMFELMAKTNQEQLREVVQDINSGWKTALETIAANTKPTIIEHRGEGNNGIDPQLLASMQEHWHRAELQLAEKLSEMQQKQAQSDQELSSLAVLAARRRLRLGDLEDDDDAERRSVQLQMAAPTPVVVNAPDNSLFVERIVRVEDKTMYTSQDVERMRAELDELKRLLAQKPAAPAPVVEPPKPKELKVAAVQQEAVVTRSNKWDTLPRATPSAAKPAEPAKVKVESVVVEEVVPPAKPEPVVVQPVVQPKPPKPVPALAPAPALSPPEEVSLVFPAAYNPELAMLLFTKEDFVVIVSGSISLDDLLFEVRKAASTKTRTRFAKVVLEFRGKRVLLGSDMGEEAARWTAEHVAGFTRTGELRLLLGGNPLTDAQIDMLAPSWEKNKVFASSGSSGPSTTAGGVGRGSVEGQRGASGGATVNTRFKKRRSWDDDASSAGAREIKGTPADVDDGFPPEEGTLPKGVYRKVRSSLEEALSEISDREGLTDSELELQRARLRETTEGLPTDVSDHLRNYKGAMAGALAAASTVDSGSDTAGGVNRTTDELFRSSVASLSGKDFGSVRTSRSLSLAPKEDGQPFTAGLLRLSRAASPHSPSGEASVSSATSHLRRSLEQFASEDDLGDANMLDDAPMLASVNNSADFRRQAAALRFTPPASAAPSSAPTPAKPVAAGMEQGRVGIAHAAPRNPHAGVVSAPPAVSTDSLMYSSVSVAGTARTRYSAEEPENSDLDDSFVERRPQPKEAPPTKPLKTRWTKAADRSEDEVSFNVTDSSAGDWAPAAAATAEPSSRPTSSPESDADARAESKTRRRGDGAALKGGSDSVDSFKREFRAAQDRQQTGAGAKGERSITESTDRFRNTGDHTVMSSIRTLDDSVDTFSDHHAFLHEQDGGRGHGHGHGLGSTATTATSNVEDMLSSTLESEGEVVAARPRADSSVGGGRRGSKSAVEHFGGLDEDASINSLALSDSNNLDEL